MPADLSHNGNRCMISQYPGTRKFLCWFAGSNLHLSSCHHGSPYVSYAEDLNPLHCNGCPGSYHAESCKHLRSIPMKSIPPHFLPCNTDRNHWASMHQRVLCRMLHLQDNYHDLV